MSLIGQKYFRINGLPVMSITFKNDINQFSRRTQKVVLNYIIIMFSKSFGYALRAILYIVLLQDESRRIQADEIAKKLSIPRYFMSKILKKLAKHGIIDSLKGPRGGFCANERTTNATVLEIVYLIDGDDYFRLCVLHLHECNSQNPCPMHAQMTVIKQALKTELEQTNIKGLLVRDKSEFIKSITTLNHDV